VKSLGERWVSIWQNNLFILNADHDDNQLYESITCWDHTNENIMILDKQKLKNKVIKVYFWIKYETIVG
jgi:hypothetical protein